MNLVNVIMLASIVSLACLMLVQWFRFFIFGLNQQQRQHHQQQQQYGKPNKEESHFRIKKKKEH